MRRRVVLYGASGHTGRFVADEMARRGWDSVLAGRDIRKVAPIADRLGAQAREADVEDDVEIDRLLAGAEAVINTAGPFGETSPRLIEAALRARIPYFDVTAEPFVAKELFDMFDLKAKSADTVVVPAFGFFGALGDLLASAALGDWKRANAIDLAFALDRWRPTNGTRLAGARRAGRRLVRIGGELKVRDPSDPVPKGSWHFDEPFGEQTVVGEFSTVDVVTLSRHIQVPSIGTWINEAPLADLSNPDRSGPEAVDESGRSAQKFAIEAVVRRGPDSRKARAAGQDIYAITAPIVCEALGWVMDGRARVTGCVAAGQLFDARQFLDSLSPEPLSVSFESERQFDDFDQRADA